MHISPTSGVLTDLPRGAAHARTRNVARKAKRVKLRARERARLECQNLELDVMNLRQEIESLKNLRRLLYERTLNRPEDGLGRFEKTIRAYYTLTRNGYFDVIWQTHKTGQAPVDMVQFMHSCFDESLAIGAQTAPHPHGLATYLKMMEQMMAVLDSPTVHLLSAHVQPGGTRHEATVAVRIQFASSLTPILLDALFPHLKVSYTWLREKLIGKRRVNIADGAFVFDRRSGLVVRVDVKIDQASSILELAESLEELQIMKGASHRATVVEVVEECQGVETGVDDPAKQSTDSLCNSRMSLHYVLSSESDLAVKRSASIA